MPAGATYCTKTALPKQPATKNLFELGFYYS